MILGFSRFFFIESELSPPQMPALNNALKDHASKNHGLPKFHIFSKRKAFFFMDTPYLGNGF